MIPMIDADGRINQRMVVDTRKSELKILKDKNRKMKNKRKTLSNQKN